MPLHLLVHGRRACFPRPEFNRDLVTYDVITPLAARIIFDQLYRPGKLRWELQHIEMLKPVERCWEPVAEPGGGRRILALKDVAYRLSAVLLDPAGLDCSGDHATAFAQRLSTAGGDLSLYFGLRDFAAQVMPASPRPRRGRSGRLRDLGWMPFDTGEERGAAALYFHAVAIAGVIDLPGIGPSSLAM